MKDLFSKLYNYFTDILLILLSIIIIISTFGLFMSHAISGLWHSNNSDSKVMSYFEGFRHKFIKKLLLNIIYVGIVFLILTIMRNSPLIEMQWFALFIFIYYIIIFEICISYLFVVKIIEDYDVKVLKAIYYGCIISNINLGFSILLILLLIVGFFIFVGAPILGLLVFVLVLTKFSNDLITKILKRYFVVL